MEGWGQNFEDAFKWKIGSEKEFSFWEDNWEGCGALKNVFPRLYSLSLLKASKVADLGVWINGVWVWNFLWRRNLFEWKKQSMCQIFQVIQGLSFDLDKEDCWVWKGGEAVSYTVNLAYNRLMGSWEGEDTTAYKQFWRCKAQPSALVTTWRVRENKITTKINLKKYGIVLDSPLCSFCRVEGESCQHLFFECRFA